MEASHFTSYTLWEPFLDLAAFAGTSAASCALAGVSIVDPVAIGSLVAAGTNALTISAASKLLKTDQRSYFLKICVVVSGIALSAFGLPYFLSFIATKGAIILTYEMALQFAAIHLISKIGIYGFYRITVAIKNRFTHRGEIKLDLRSKVQVLPPKNIQPNSKTETPSLLPDKNENINTSKKADLNVKEEENKPDLIITVPQSFGNSLNKIKNFEFPKISNPLPSLASLKNKFSSVSPALSKIHSKALDCSHYVGRITHNVDWKKVGIGVAVVGIVATAIIFPFAAVFAPKTGSSLTSHGFEGNTTGISEFPHLNNDIKPSVDNPQNPPVNNVKDKDPEPQPKDDFEDFLLPEWLQQRKDDVDFRSLYENNFENNDHTETNSSTETSGLSQWSPVDFFKRNISWLKPDSSPTTEKNDVVPEKNDHSEVNPPKVEVGSDDFSSNESVDKQEKSLDKTSPEPLETSNEISSLNQTDTFSLVNTVSNNLFSIAVGTFSLLTGIFAIAWNRRQVNVLNTERHKKYKTAEIPPYRKRQNEKLEKDSSTKQPKSTEGQKPSTESSKSSSKIEISKSADVERDHLLSLDELEKKKITDYLSIEIEMNIEEQKFQFQFKNKKSKNELKKTINRTEEALSELRGKGFNDQEILDFSFKITKPTICLRNKDVEEKFSLNIDDPATYLFCDKVHAGNNFDIEIWEQLSSIREKRKSEQHQVSLKKDFSKNSVANLKKEEEKIEPSQNNKKSSPISEVHEVKTSPEKQLDMKAKISLKDFMSKTESWDYLGMKITMVNEKEGTSREIEYSFSDEQKLELQRLNLIVSNKGSQKFYDKIEKLEDILSTRSTIKQVMVSFPEKGKIKEFLLDISDPVVLEFCHRVVLKIESSLLEKEVPTLKEENISVRSTSKPVTQESQNILNKIAQEEKPEETKLVKDQDQDPSLKSLQDGKPSTESSRSSSKVEISKLIEVKKDHSTLVTEQIKESTKVSQPLSEEETLKKETKEEKSEPEKRMPIAEQSSQNINIEKASNEKVVDLTMKDFKQKIEKFSHSVQVEMVFDGVKIESTFDLHTEPQKDRFQGIITEVNNELLEKLGNGLNDKDILASSLNVSQPMVYFKGRKKEEQFSLKIDDPSIYLFCNKLLANKNFYSLDKTQFIKRIKWIKDLIENTKNEKTVICEIIETGSSRVEKVVLDASEFIEMLTAMHENLIKTGATSEADKFPASLHSFTVFWDGKEDGSKLPLDDRLMKMLANNVIDRGIQKMQESNPELAETILSTEKMKKTVSRLKRYSTLKKEIDEAKEIKKPSETSKEESENIDNKKGTISVTNLGKSSLANLENSSEEWKQELTNLCSSVSEFFDLKDVPGNTREAYSLLEFALSSSDFDTDLRNSILEFSKKPESQEVQKQLQKELSKTEESNEVQDKLLEEFSAKDPEEFNNNDSVENWKIARNKLLSDNEIGGNAVETYASVLQNQQKPFLFINDLLYGDRIKQALTTTTQEEFLKGVFKKVFDLRNDKNKLVFIPFVLQSSLGFPNHIVILVYDPNINSFEYYNSSSGDIYKERRNILGMNLSANAFMKKIRESKENSRLRRPDVVCNPNVHQVGKNWYTWDLHNCGVFVCRFMSQRLHRDFTSICSDKNIDIQQVRKSMAEEIEEAFASSSLKEVKSEGHLLKYLRNEQTKRAKNQVQELKETAKLLKEGSENSSYFDKSKGTFIKSGIFDQIDKDLKRNKFILNTIEYDGTPNKNAQAIFDALELTTGIKDSEEILQWMCLLQQTLFVEPMFNIGKELKVNDGTESRFNIGLRNGKEVNNRTGEEQDGKYISDWAEKKGVSLIQWDIEASKGQIKVSGSMYAELYGLDKPFKRKEPYAIVKMVIEVNSTQKKPKLSWNIQEIIENTSKDEKKPDDLSTFTMIDTPSINVSEPNK